MDNKEQTNVQQELSELIKILQESEYDGQSTKNEQYAKDLLKAHRQVVERNLLLTNLLRNYIHQASEKNKENKIYKRILFFFFIIIVMGLTAGVVTVLVTVDFNSATVPLVVSLLSVGATYLGSLFTIYDIMFKYLFPVDEEKDMINMIKTVIENDSKVEEFASKIGVSQRRENNKEE